MSQFKWAVLACVALATDYSQARTVELALDVTTTDGTLNTYYGSNVVRVPDPTFVPKTFSMLLRIDLGTAQPFLQLEGQPLSILSGTSPLSFALTPYSPAFLAILPSEAPRLESTSWAFSKVLDQNEDPSYPVFNTERASIGAGRLWSISTNPLPQGQYEFLSEISYGQGITLEHYPEPMARQDLRETTEEDFLDWLTSKVGTTGIYPDNFSFAESVNKIVRNTNPAGCFDGTFYNYNCQVSVEGKVVRGDVYLRSVTVVPEPSSMLLTAGGLAGVGVSCWRGRAKRRLAGC
ncbi:MAG: PEP-CTERM sorting domain-containing protein [Betaproteobacteria bacterium]